ncbi:uncharacterized protein [Magallana gigas]|uniref:uncharacterized protein isoform X2 n=1 Tax=Magallana gigas TaxID=29159 RepID=UPI00333E3AA6
MTKKHIGTRILDVFAHAPGTLKENLYSLPVNVLILCLILCKCVSVGYFVMGLVWKLHTDVIDESWIRILNRLWIGNLRLGSTVNGLVFTAICLFPVYVIAGTLGLVGVFCKKKICIVLYMVFLLMFLMIDIVYVSLFAALLTNMKSFSLASDFQGIYTSFVRLNQNSQTDVKNIKADWLQMFQLLGCCGITNNDGDSHCTSYISTRPCWEKFSDTMTTYCSSYLSLSGILFFLEIIQLSLCDLIYSQLSREKKLPFALAKTFISKMQFSWKTSRKTVLTNICRVLSSINAIVLIILGSVLLNDDQMTGEYVYHIYIQLYFCGLNFTDIINGLGHLMIVLGTLELFANISAVLADVKFPENKTKSAMLLGLNSLLMVLKIIVLSLCTQLVLQMNGDEPRKQMAYLLRNYSMGDMARNWMYLFSELQCCGIISGYDFSDFIPISHGHYPITCCRMTLYDASYSQILSSTEVYGQYCDLIQTGCLGKLTENFQIYTTGFLVTTAMSIAFGSMVIVFTTAQLKSIYSTNLKKDGIPEENVVDRKHIAKRLITYCKMNLEDVILMIATILCIIFGSALLIEGFLFKYDSIFNHHIIREVLFNNITFEGLSFTDIRQSQCSFMFATGTVLVVFCGSGIFMLKTQSKYLHIIQMVFVSLALALTIIGLGLWGKIKDSISYQLQNETEIFLDRFRYNSNRQFAHLLTSEGALNNLFAKAECCGLAFSDGSELSLGGGEKIPIFCCKSNPLTEPSLLSNDNCTKGIDPSLRHRTVACNDAILTRLGYYDTSFFCFTSLTILCLIIQLSFYIYRLCKRNFTPLQKEKYFNLLKSQGGDRLSVVFEWRTLFLFLVMISSVSMVVFGVLLKHDDKMTGDSVHNIYLFLYFRGANFNDIVEAMYLSLIVLGISSLVCSMLGLSDIFKPLRHTVKEKIFIVVLFILIPAKLTCVFLLESIHSEIDTYSNSTNYQFLNMDRQFSNRYSGVYIHLNNFYRQFDCCGSTGSHGFRDLVSNAGYGSVSGYQPDVCCYGYTQTNFLGNSNCEKRACGGEFLSSVDYYSYGLIASMSTTALFEIICLIFSMYYLLCFKKQEQSKIKTWISELLKKFCSRRHLCGLACGVLKLMLSMAFLAETVALRYDEIFSNKQIYFLLARVSMAGNSFTTNLVIFRWLMATSGCLLLLDSIYSFLTIYKESKILHAFNIAFCVLGISFVLSTLGFWIAVDVENFPNELLSQSPVIYNFFSRLDDGYLMNEHGAWNNLFVKLKCCGYNYGNASDFPHSIVLQDRMSTGYNYFYYYSHQKTPLFCCHFNPLTQTYNSDINTCTSPGGSDYRYSEILTIIILSRLIKSDLPLKEDPILLKMRVHPTTRRKLKKASEEQRNENQDTSEVEEKEQNELPQISTTENMNGTVLEENQDEKSEKIEKKKRRRGGKVKPMSDIPNPVQRPLSKLPPLQMQRNP